MRRALFPLLLAALALSPARPASGQAAPEPRLGSAPQPTRAVPARPPDREQLATARKLLAGGGTAGHLGPYLFYTDARDAELLAFLDRVAAGIEETYGARYGRAPLGKPAEAVVLFAGEAEYKSFQDRDPQLAERAASGHSGHGIVALFDGGRLRREVAATLVHELAHLLNRRALGPLLPSWLDEGIADDLAQSRLDDSGRLLPGTLSGARAKVGNRIHIYGAQAGLARLAQTIDAGALPPLPQLLDLPWQGFVGSEDGLNYLHAAFFVRYLLEGEGGALAPPFRAYLKDAGEGGTVAPEALRERLGRSWEELEAGFRKWVEAQAGGS
jgi:hypothetical protein